MGKSCGNKGQKDLGSSPLYGSDDDESQDSQDDSHHESGSDSENSDDEWSTVEEEDCFDDSNSSENSSDWSDESQIGIFRSSSSDDDSVSEADTPDIFSVVRDILFGDLNDRRTPEIESDTHTLLDAIQYNDLEGVKEVIHLNDDAKKRVAFIEAIQRGQVEIVKYFLEIAAVDLKCTFQKSPIHLAISHINDPERRKQMVMLLLDSGGSIANETEQYKTTSLHTAVRQGDTELVKILLNQGAKINCFDSSRRSPLHMAMHLEGKARIEMTQQLVTAGADIKITQRGYTCLHHALTRDDCDWDLVQLLVDTGAQINCMTDENLSPLAVAVVHSGYDLIKKLIEAGADVNISQLCKNSALALAIQKQRKDVIGLLLQHGASVNCKDKNGRSILYYATKMLKDKEAYENINILKMILSKGVSSSSSEVGEYSPIRMLLSYGSVKSVKLFLDHGFKLREFDPHLPLHCAATNDDKDVLEFLLHSHLFDIDEMDNDDCTALIAAISNYNFPCMKLLIEWGAKVDTYKGSVVQEIYKDPSNIPVIEAIHQKMPEIVDLLLSAGATLNFKSESEDRQRTSLGSVLNVDADFLNIFIREMALLASQGIKYVPNSAVYLETDRNGINRMLKCVYELESLESSVFTGSVSLYDLLTGKDLTRFIKNDGVATNFESLRVVERFPLYGRRIQECYNLACVKRNLIDDAIEKSIKVIPSFRLLNRGILFNIIMQLSLRDLRSLCDI